MRVRDNAIPDFWYLEEEIWNTYELLNELITHLWTFEKILEAVDFNQTIAIARRFETLAERLTENDLKQIGLTGRYTLSCEPLDIDISIGGIIVELIGEKFINATIGRRNCSATSERKKSASRKNGKLGGRPKKVAG